LSEKSRRKIRKAPMEQLADFSGYPIEGLEKIPLFDCKWNREIRITCCTGVLEYDANKIVLHTKRGKCGIIGEGLQMENFRGDTLTIHGKICSIWFGERGEGDV